MLAQVLGVRRDALLICRDLINEGKAYYKWQTPKVSGGMRDITSPVEELKRVQRLILERVLYNFTVHMIAHGFVRGRDITTNAAAHLGWGAGLNMDLKDAFPSVREDRVIANLKKPLAHFLRRQFGRRITQQQIDEILHMLVKLCVHEGCLPQGTPTSPALLNIVCLNLDRELSFLAAEHGLTVTRYADDISFSTAEDSIPGAVQRRIRAIISNAGWKIHPKKTHYVRRAGSLNDFEVTGLLVGQDGRLTVPKRRREAYKNFMIHLYEQEEISEGERQQVLGIVVYLSRIYRGHLPSSLRRHWLRVKEKHGFGDAPTQKRHGSVDPYAPPMVAWSKK